MRLEELVHNFNTTPFLFIGSGLTRRYLNLPNWESLLEYFSKKISNSEFIYNSYEQKAKQMSNPVGLMPRIAELIENDFNDKWFKDPTIRTLSESELDMVKKGISPFKVEVASYIKRKGKVNENYQKEINQFEGLASQNISGVITTNYDTFIEDHFNQYKTYVGQNELLFSAIQGIAEIYKIHGSVEKPNSIVIDEKDYENFNSRKAYLAAKLLTIFVEYPIIFIGYSLNDENIQSILKEIVNCLNQDQLNTLRNRFIFIDYQQDKENVEVIPTNMKFSDANLPMTRVTLSDFSYLYKALANKKTELPVRLLRCFKRDLYEYVITNSPTGTMRVASIDDKRIKDEDLVLAIGKASDLSLHGLKGISGDEWYRNIVLSDLPFSADDLLKEAFPSLISQNSHRLPVNKLLTVAKGNYPEAEKTAKNNEFDDIISNTIKKNRKYHKYASVNEIWKKEHNNLEKATELVSYLTEDQFDVNELESVLKEIFNKNGNILQETNSATRTNIRRLIRIYDYLKWGK